LFSVLVPILWIGRIIDEHPHRRGLEIVVLPPSNAVPASYQPCSSEKDRQRQSDVENAHNAASEATVFDDGGNVRAERAMVNTVMPLKGINRAAISGWIQPVTAKLIVIALYKSDAAKQR
jgi:hypothetical protein